MLTLSEMFDITYITKYFSFTTLFLFAVLTFLVLHVLRRSCDLPPGPTPFPLIGNLWRVLVMKNLPEDLILLSNQYGPVMSLKLGPARAVVLSTYDTIHEAFVTRANVTLGRPVLYKSCTHGYGGILMTDGPKWKSIRRFSMSTLRDFGYGRDLLQEKIVSEMRFLMEALDANSGRTCDNFRERVTSATSNVICSLVFGRRFDYDDKSFQHILEVQRQIMSRFNFMDVTVLLDMIPLLANQKRISEVIHGYHDTLGGFIQAEVNNHKQDFDESNLRDFIDVYLKLAHDNDAVHLGFCERDLFSTITDLFLAGTETTGTTMSWAILYMMAYPEVIGGDRPIRYQDRSRLPYVQATIYETLRCTNVVPLGIPHRTTEETSIGGYRIPKSSLLIANLHAANHEENRFDAPHVFRPERFLNEDGVLVNTDSVISFSLGPRRCLGEALAKSQIFVYFANLVNHFTFVTPDDKLVDLTANSKNGTIREPPPYRVEVTHRRH